MKSKCKILFDVVTSPSFPYSAEHLSNFHWILPTPLLQRKQTKLTINIQTHQVNTNVSASMIIHLHYGRVPRYSVDDINWWIPENQAIGYWLVRRAIQAQSSKLIWASYAESSLKWLLHQSNVRQTLELLPRIHILANPSSMPVAKSFGFVYHDIAFLLYLIEAITQDLHIQWLALSFSFYISWEDDFLYQLNCRLQSLRSWDLLKEYWYMNNMFNVKQSGRDDQCLFIELNLDDDIFSPRSMGGQNSEGWQSSDKYPYRWSYFIL